MSIFVDTSAFFAVLDVQDRYHRRANLQWQDLMAGDEVLYTSNYVLVEAMALIQSRLGLGALIDFQTGFFPILNVDWVGEADHLAGVATLLSTSRRRLSLVDSVSFVSMSRLGIKRCFAFDPHFREQGFECLP